MKNINEYKKIFYNLMESTMGDVRPLINEDKQHEEFVTPTKEMMKDRVCHELKTYDRVDTSLTLNGNEYRLTFPEGMYTSSEKFSYRIHINKILNLVVRKPGVVKSNNVVYFETDDKGWEYEFIVQFVVPKTQKELKQKSPYIAYIDVPCKNVRGGKIRFSAEIPSGAEIFELPKSPKDAYGEKESIEKEVGGFASPPPKRNW